MMNKDDINYNSEPVYWCNSCMSLNIKSVDGIDYCDKCGSTDIVVTSIEEWQTEKERRLKLFNLKNKEDGRRSKKNEGSKKE